MHDTNYSKRSTADLIERIACYSDAKALNEFLCQRKLLWLDRVRCLLPDFLWRLRQRRFKPYIFIAERERAPDEKLDMVYDRTLQKFSVLHPQIETATSNGPYCNRQYIHLHEKICQMRVKQPDQSTLEEEKQVGTLFRNLVIKHINYSWKEACRITNKSFERYRWQVDSGYIGLERPSWMNGHKFRKWLEEHVSHPDANRMGEKERIQAQVYNTFGFGNQVSWEHLEGWHPALATNPDPVEESERTYLASKLYVTVANEKAASLQQQRPAIRKLGKQKLRRLVLRILHDYIDDGQKDIRIVREFNLSKATFSRFAGRDWRRSKAGGEAGAIPDLWYNMANVISQDPRFLEAATSLGLASSIDSILDQTE